MSEPHPFDADTAVSRTAAGEFDATVSERWSLLAGHANGGYALGLCVRALQAEAAYPDPVVVTAHYLRRVLPGPARLIVDPIRVGRRLWVGEVRLMQDGKEKVRASAAFADLATASGRTELRNSAPDLPPPEQCLALSDEHRPPGLTLADRVEYRYRTLPGWRTGTPNGRLDYEFWMRFAPGPDGRIRDADTLALPALVDMATPPVLDLGELSSTTIELSVHVRGVPAPGWLACRSSTRHVIDGYHEEDFEAWDSTGRLVAQARQLALLPNESRSPFQQRDARVAG
ncbi:MAG: thioesterase family protein [Jatrophihabitantaceae bacterium]